MLEDDAAGRGLVSLNPRHFFISTEINRNADGFARRERLRENAAAIEALKAIESSGRDATEDERAALVRYNGWGGLADVLDPQAALSQAERESQQRLQQSITDAEWDSARASVNNAHFTAPMIARELWRAAQRLGFRGGRVLDPSGGVGTFLGCAPPDIVRTSQFFLVEKDGLTGRIAKAIYPDASVYVQGFEELRFPKRSFDLVITNVPFGNYRVFDPEYDEQRLSIHDYFIVKSLDLLRPGGVGIFITSSHTLDKRSAKARLLMHERAELAAAVRLPDDAHEAQAGTKVTTDVLCFVSRPRPQADGEPVWLTAETQALAAPYAYQPIETPVNGYFVAHPEMILGTLKLGRGEFGRYRTVVDADRPLEQTLPDAVERIEQKEPSAVIRSPEKTAPPPTEVVLDIRRTIGRQDIGTLIVDDDGRIGAISEFIEHEGEQRALITWTALAGKEAARVAGMIRVRDALLDTLQAQSEGRASDIQRDLLNRVYDGFVEEHGPLNAPANRRLFRAEPSAGLVFALEHYDDEDETAAKADVFVRPVIGPVQTPEHVDTPKEALAICLNESGRVDLNRIASLCRRSAQDVRGELTAASEIFLDPDTQQWQTAAAYLSGNVRAKLATASEAVALDATFERNVQALSIVQPLDLDPSEIDARLGAPWIPEEVVRDFVAELLDLEPGRVTATYTPVIGFWEMAAATYGASRIKATSEFGTSRRDAVDLINRGLNQQSVSVYDTVELPGGGKKQVLNMRETVAAQDKLSAIQGEFIRFLWSDPPRAARLARLYNDRFNNYVPPSYDGTHLTFPGMNAAIEPRRHQKNAVWRAVQEGRALFAHEVGTGKTIVQAASAIELKRLGRAAKPLWTVPNHMLEQIEREARQLYPSAKILAVSREDLRGDRRQEFVGRVANNNWDLVIMTHSLFAEIRVPPAFEQEFIGREIRELRVELDALRYAENAPRLTVKQIERSLKSLHARLQALAEDLDVRQKYVTIDQLGVDCLLVDESHLFKNLMVPNAAGVEVTDHITGSQRAWDLYVKTRWLYDRRGGVSGVLFATGTPITNNLLELYNTQRYLQPDLLDSAGIASIAAWAGVFLEAKTRWEPEVSGNGFRPRTRAALRNVPEMIRMYRQAADVVYADDAGIPRPVAERFNVVAQMSKTQRRVLKELHKRVEKIRQGGVDPSDDNLLKIVTEGRKLALDPRLFGLGYGDNPTSKLALAAEQMARLWEETRDSRGTQIMFCDMGTPSAQRAFNVYDDLKRKLVDRGVPESEIAFIHDCDSDREKAKLFEQVRAGKIRFMFGSTEKMGIGTNAQTRVVAVHHLDPPWRPSDIEQRNARGVRQGNMNDTCRIYVYTTKDTFDFYMWDVLQRKADTFHAILRGRSGVRRFDLEVDPTYAETAAITSGNPIIKEKLETEQEGSRLEQLAKAHWEMIGRMHREADYLHGEANAFRRDAAILRGVAPLVHGDWEFDSRPYGGRTAIRGSREKLLEALRALRQKRVDHVEGVRFGGVPVALRQALDANNNPVLNWVVRSGEEELVFPTAARLEEELLGREERVTQLERLADRKEAQAALAREQAAKPFDREQDLLEAKRKLQEIIRKIEEQHMPQTDSDEVAVDETERAQAAMGTG